jgi:hypothetical protein
MSEEQKAIPDRLALVRARLVALQAEEAALRDILLSDPSTRIGGDYVATVREVSSRRVSNKALEKADPVLFEKLAVSSVMRQVRLARRDTDEVAKASLAAIRRVS